MGQLEEFKPHIRMGKLSLEADRIVYEIDHPAQQIILPLEMSEIIGLCNGQLSIREIISHIYKSRGYVQVKTIINTIKQLSDLGFLTNSSEFPDIRGLSENSPFLNEYKSIKLPIAQRLYNDRKRPFIFYITALIASVFALLLTPNVLKSLSVIPSDPNPGVFAAALFLSLSFLYTFKNFFKLLLQSLLTGRSYHISLKSPFFCIHLDTPNESLFLVSNTLYIYLYHFACFVSPMIGATLASHFITDANALLGLWYSGWLILLLETNPFDKNDLVRIFTQMFKKEHGLKQLNNNEPSSFAGYTLREIKINGLSPASLTLVQILFLWTGFFSFLAWKYTSLISAQALASKTPLQLSGTTALVLFGLYIFGRIFYNLFIFGRIAYKDFIRIKLNIIRNRNSRMVQINDFDVSHLQKIVAQQPLFYDLPTELLSLILQKSNMYQASAGVTIIEEGQEGKDLFVLLSGHLQVYKKRGGNSQLLTNIYPTSIFGELAVIERTKRNATVIAQEDSLMLAIPADMLLNSIGGTSYIEELEGFKNSILVSQFFNSAPYFKDLNPQVIQTMLQKALIEHVKPGQTIFEQGDYGDSFYLLLKGLCSVSIHAKHIGNIYQNGFFGEVSLIADIPRTASVHADMDCTLLRIDKDTFWEVLAMDVQMAIILEEVTHYRIRQDIEELRGNQSKVA